VKVAAPDPASAARGGRKVGEIEEGISRCSIPATPSSSPARSGLVSGRRPTSTPWSPGPPQGPEDAQSWGGSKFALSTFLAARVRELMFNRGSLAVLPPDVREWLEAAGARSRSPRREDEMLLETFPRGSSPLHGGYPFEGRLAHTTLAMLLTRRLERLEGGPLGFVATTTPGHLGDERPLDGLDLDALFEPDMLGDDLEAWLSESFMMKRAFKGCAIISGLIERRFPGARRRPVGR
jgi:ATP-dependent Lhr-like helicase